MSHLSPPTLTEAEQRAILSATTVNARDHLIYSLALGTGLRLAEIVGLNVGDAFFPDGRPRTRVRIRPEIAKGGRSGDVFLPDALVAKLRKFWAWKAHRGEGLRLDDSLFSSQGGRRISKRRVQFAWREWQKRVGFDRLYPFHGLRHTSITAVYRMSRDLFLAQRFARHVSPWVGGRRGTRITATEPVGAPPARHTGHADFPHPALPVEFLEKVYGTSPLGTLLHRTP